MALTSSTDIANLALNKLGAATIQVITEPERNAEVMNLNYEPTRDEVLRMFSWTCAIKRATLVVNVGTNDSTFTYMYDLPADFLRLLDINGKDNIVYRIEGTLLYTNQADAKLRYVCRLEDVTKWDSILVETIATRLASKGAYRITSDLNMVAAMQQEYLMLLASAAQLSAVEQKEDHFKLLQFFKEAGYSAMRPQKNNYVQE